MITSTTIDDLNQPLYFGFAISKETGGTNVILSFGGEETTESFTNLILRTYNTRLKVGSGFLGYMSDLKISRVKSAISYFEAQYLTNSCPDYCTL